MKRSSILLFLIILYSSCELLDQPLSVEPAEVKMSLSSLRLGNEGFVISVTKSFSALSATSMNNLADSTLQTLFVNRGLVEIRTRNEYQIAEKLQDVPGLYATTFTNWVPGDSLFLTVTDSVSLERVTAKTKIMSNALIDSVHLLKTDSTRFFDSLYVKLIDPDIEETNYYVLHLYDFTSFIESQISNDSLFSTTNSPLLYEHNFSDARVDSLIQEFTFTIPSEIGNDTLLLSLSHIEEGYFRFLDARKRNADGASGLFNEPITFPGNVVNGYGYVSAHFPQFRIVIRKSD